MNPAPARSAAEGADRARARVSAHRRSERDARDVRRDRAQLPRGTALACDLRPDAHQAFDQVRRDLQASGRGKLTIEVDDAAVVFINEAYRAAGSTTVELLPGEYRVVVMMNEQPSRKHRVAVRANAETTVEIDAKLGARPRRSVLRQRDQPAAARAGATRRGATTAFRNGRRGGGAAGGSSPRASRSAGSPPARC